MTEDAHYINSRFIDKIEKGGELLKEAEVNITSFIRSKLREDAFSRQILTPQMVTSDQLDRDVATDKPKKIIDKEPESRATFVSFRGMPQSTYFTGPRYEIYFAKITSDTFTKSIHELKTYDNDIRQILSDNSIKDIQEQEDVSFMNTSTTATDSAITAAEVAALDDADYFLDGGTGTDADLIGWVRVLKYLDRSGAGTAPDAGEALLFAKAQKLDFTADNNPSLVNLPSYVEPGLNKWNYLESRKALRRLRLPLGVSLMSQATAEEIIKWDANIIGDGAATVQYEKGLVQSTLFGGKALFTIKNDIVPDGEVWHFTAEDFLGKFFFLQDATVYIKHERDIISFDTYEVLGIGFGNLKGIIRCRFWVN